MKYSNAVPRFKGPPDRKDSRAKTSYTSSLVRDLSTTPVQSSATTLPSRTRSMAYIDMRSQRRNHRLRQTLIHSQREAVSSSLMTGLCDNFINAFAIHLKATMPQVAWLTAMPQFIGASAQLLAVWMGSFLSRPKLIAGAALLQAMAVMGLALLAWSAPVSAVTLLILITTLYHSAGNLVQPHWRALMGCLVPDRRRGRFFANRTRNSMITAFLVFIAGGAVSGYDPCRACGAVWLHGVVSDCRRRPVDLGMVALSDARSGTETRSQGRARVSTDFRIDPACIHESGVPTFYVVYRESAGNGRDRRPVFLRVHAARPSLHLYRVYREPRDFHFRLVSDP